jgi:choline dehydrogenase-like flavoprotein
MAPCRGTTGCDVGPVALAARPTPSARPTSPSSGALERGAQLFTGLAVDRVLTEGETAVGVSGLADGPRGKVRVNVRAKVVVLACGTLHTPALLLKSGLANASGEVGRNLSIHPALGVIALFDEPVHGWRTVPQGYAIHEFQDEASCSRAARDPGHDRRHAPGVGRQWVDLVERANHWLGRLHDQG